jgi:3-dehydroquinate dehydratase-1
MKHHRLLKPGRSRPRLVGVIASPEALIRACRIRRLPDLFELRLDALHDSLGEVERALPRLRAPLILTARDPAEGGQNHLPLALRRTSIERFLDRAAFVDLELRDVRQMHAFLAQIRRRGIGLILSAHRLDRTPASGELKRLVRSAATFRPDLFKLVLRTDNSADLERLVSFFTGRPRTGFPIAAMGLGRLGLRSRIILAQLGSPLVYASVGEPVIQGQPSLSRLRRTRKAYIK